MKFNITRTVEKNVEFVELDRHNVYEGVLDGTPYRLVRLYRGWLAEDKSTGKIMHSHGTATELISKLTGGEASIA